MPRVLVTDSSERAALAVIRSLGKRGIEIIAADSVGLNAGFFSKYCSQRFIYPSPLQYKSKFVKSILYFVKRSNVDLLIPITDFTMIPILENNDEFEGYVKVAAPPFETAIKALDKFQTVRIAEKCGVPFPKSFIPFHAENIEEIATIVRYPVVIKPRMKVFWNGEQAVLFKVTSRNYAYNEQDLMRKYDRIISEFGKFGVPCNFFMIQEFAKGSSYGVELLMNKSELKAVFMHKRIREYPITGGASTLRMSIWDRRLMDYAVNLLREMGWQGVAMVEFKLNEQDRSVKLIEVNGRFWGSLSLAINAGVDFPYFLYKILSETCHFNPPTYFVGIKQRWLIPGDLLWFYSSVITRREFLRPVKDFLDSFIVKDDIISLDDPVPTLGILKTSLGYIMDVLRGTRSIAGEFLRSRE
ncbi:MAG: ATP-grasp domain-containing protein [Candidatus Methanomethyliaceae archaeon]